MATYANMDKDGNLHVEALPINEKGQAPAIPDDPDAGLSEEERRRIDRQLLWKLDLHLIPWLCLLYLISFLDRTNIGNAKIAGLQKDLSMTDGQWNAALAIFFVSYSVFEPVSNVLLKKFKPSRYIPTIMFFWGIACVCCGLVHNFSGLAAARWWLGFFEAGLFPGCNFYLSCWYKRSEFGVRSAIFFSAAAIAGSFGGLLAWGISQMHGVAGRPGWAWIFILEGLATVVIGVLSIWMVHDFPDEAGFLSAEDRLRVYHRLKVDQQASAEREAFKWDYVTASLKDWKTYTSCLIFMGAGGGLYAFSLFLPTILAELGYKATTAQLMSVPPYAAAALLTVAIGFIADKTRQRGVCAILVSSLGVIGFAILISDAPVGAKYAATFLAACGIYPCIPNSLTWLANNTEGVYKRGVSIGLAMGWANLQGVVISNVYRRKDAPRFIAGHAVVIGYLGIALFGGSVLQHLLLRRENRLRKAGARNHLLEGKSESELNLMGDQRPDFIYIFYCIKLRAKCVYPEHDSTKLPDIDNDVLSRLKRIEISLVRLETRLAKDNAPSPSGSLSGGRPSQTSVEQPTDVHLTPGGSGRLVVEEGDTRYVNGSFWATLEQEGEEQDVPPLLTTVATAPASVPSADHDSNDYQRFIFGMSVAPEASGLRHLHPSETRIFTLWQIYLESVDPLLKILHVPTTQAQMLRACSHLDTIPAPIEAVMFAIYYAAVTSLQNSTQIVFNENPEALLKQYRTGLEQALVNANFMTMPEMPTLQALTLYLICARQSIDKTYVWSMVALLYRLASKIGLHRDPASLGLPPFMVEMRRRLWWQICILDVRTAEDNDMDPLICGHHFDTKYPSNVNDGDLDVNMIEPLRDTKHRTDMLFCLTRFEISYVARKLVFSPKFATDNGYPSMTLLEKTQLIDETLQGLNEKYLKYCDQQIPICFLAVTASRLVLAKMKLTIHHPTRNESSKLSQDQFEGLARSSIEIIEYAHQLRTNAKYSRWIWLFQQYVEWDAVAFLLHSLSVSPLPSMASRAWEAIEAFLADWKGHVPNGSHERRWRRLLTLQEKAKAKQTGSTVSQNAATIPDHALQDDSNSSGLIGTGHYDHHVISDASRSVLWVDFRRGPEFNEQCA
ncbi:hypothetical protein H2200_006014 [Cladophialophora chaetospira]|uniref:Xylanolytic transcriptional activator regulatory domain-containing protein n=1 Tax=Cladophialophora chaetospira TaxID=386627 RepID=A0AA38XAA4_9EURO|nr:hypothetical protein H2200_006014 [Cladophialophora chaetospira]